MGVITALVLTFLLGLPVLALAGLRRGTHPQGGEGEDPEVLLSLERGEVRIGKRVYPLPKDPYRALAEAASLIPAGARLRVVGNLGEEAVLLLRLLKEAGLIEAA